MDTQHAGKVVSIEDHGTIVIVFVAPTDGRLEFPVYFDHRPFSHMYEARGGHDGIIGKDVVAEMGNGTLQFVDELDAE